ncbi:GPP34 family phosphoprotein [Streptomyces sp. NPDC008150]|uniref:GOLPH3/VPS74 family protein n=1 Tax=Streptomyces sp. NPDC008150 TaxID=3364816 RepID=UPI0036E2D31C
MTTARDLFIIVTDPASKDTVGQGDLSLALAGAELLDLVEAGLLTVAEDRVVPDGDRARTADDPSRAPDDRLLAAAWAGVVPGPPFEEVEDWLWRRGRDLSAAYQEAFEKDGELTRKRNGVLSFASNRLVQADTPARRQAAARWQDGEPVLAALASAVRNGGELRDGDDELGSTEHELGNGDETAVAVLAAVRGAIVELEAVRQRRSIENAAYANIWRAP